MWEEILLGCLILSNAITLWWAFNKRVKATPQVVALQRAIASFEVQGQTILRIDRINPDHVYLMNPSR